jgi:predicted MFS family arabinose efflux permease
VPDSRKKLYFGWIVLAAVVVVMLAGSGVRAMFGVFIKPIEAELGWSRQQLSGAAALSGAMSAGQMLVVPLAMLLIRHYGWRASFLWLGVGILVFALPVILWLVRDDPADKGLKPYGAGTASDAAFGATLDARRVPIGEAMQVPAFWLLAATFFVCGYTSNGLVLTHLVPHATEHGFSEMHAAQALGLMGAMNIVGTIASGWICDRFGRKVPLAIYYGLRGLSLIFLLYVWNVPSLHIFAAIFGLNYISTIPPTTTLTANIFGRLSVGALSGWIYFSHQVGSALGAWVGGAIFDATGSYAWAFLSAAVLALIASGLSLLIKEEPISAKPTRARQVPAGSPAVAS